MYSVGPLLLGSYPRSQGSIRSRRSLDTGDSEMSMSPDTTEGLWYPSQLADLLGLGYGDLGVMAETPLKGAAEKRKSEDMSDMSFHFGGRQKKTRTGL